MAITEITNLLTEYLSLFLQPKTHRNVILINKLQDSLLHLFVSWLMHQGAESITDSTYFNDDVRRLAVQNRFVDLK